jgi:hypothetical protein
MHYAKSHQEIVTRTNFMQRHRQMSAFHRFLGEMGRSGCGNSMAKSEGLGADRCSAEEEMAGIKRLFVVDLSSHLARLSEEDACRPATDVLDAVCVSWT